jgi:hypothetical protein
LDVSGIKESYSIDILESENKKNKKIRLAVMPVAPCNEPVSLRGVWRRSNPKVSEKCKVKSEKV